MNKISKKIVALVTMAAFVLTLVPAAAFAAESYSDQTSKIITVDENVEVKAGDSVELQLRLLDASGKPANETSNVVIWAENANGTVSDALQSTDLTATSNASVFKANGDSDVADKAKVTVSFKRTGTFTIHAGVVESYTNVAAGSDKDTVFPEAAKLVEFSGDATNHNAVKVTAADPAEATGLLVKQEDNTAAGIASDYIDKTSDTVALNSVLPNSADTDTVNIKVTDKSDNPIAGKEVTVNASAGLTVTGDTVTDEDGIIELTYSAAREGKYSITVKVDKLTQKFTVTPVASTATPETITVVKDGGVAKLDNTVTNIDLKDVVQFNVVDKNGNVVPAETANWANEPVYTDNVSGQKRSDYVDVVDQPDKADVKDDQVKLIPAEDGLYTLQFQSGATVVEGDYTIKVKLVNGKSAEVSFTVKEAGDPVELVIEGDDTVSSADAFNGSLYYIDANGIKTDAQGSGLNVYYTQSNAVDTQNGFDFTVTSDNDISFKAVAGKEYYGSKVTIFAMDDNGLTATKEVTVVDPTLTKTVAFEYDNTNGAILQDNTVKVTLVDEDGNVVKALDGKTLNATVMSTSAEDANVSIVNDGNSVTNGKANISVYADRETVADILVTVVDGSEIYADTLTYTFGEQDIPADTSVVMTIGSSDFVVNNNVVSVEDAAPYIANDRTYVPFRALGEALGAEVVWDNDARTVTYTLGKTEVVMTIGETTYTVNGEEKTMDVAPEITGDRTYVPVRFVGEALGFKVTALSAADGTTASVVFQK